MLEDIELDLLDLVHDDAEVDVQRSFGLDAYKVCLVFCLDLVLNLVAR